MMLNPQLSFKQSSIKKSKSYKEKQKSSTSTTTKRSPFQDLKNNGGFSRNNSSSSSSSSISSSDAPPKGCLSFFNSNPSSSRTPTSAPTAKLKSLNSSVCSRSSKPFNENHVPKPKFGLMKKNLTSFRSGSKSKLLGDFGSFRSNLPSVVKEFGQKSKLLGDFDDFMSNLPCGSVKLGQKSELLGDFRSNMPSGSEKLGQKSKYSKREMRGVDNAGDNCTPVGKLACGSNLVCANCVDSNVFVEKGSTSSGKTPPIQASVSPEIQCGGSYGLDSTNTKTPSTCYGAGHFISGVTDKRKCRPKGILTVGVGLDSSGCNLGGNVSGSDDIVGHYIKVLRKSRSSLVPLPVGASMSWNLSPCHEEDGGDSPNRLPQDGNLASSPSSCDGFASFLCNDYDCSSTANSDSTPSGQKTRITVLSPRRLPGIEGLLETSFLKGGGSLTSSRFVTPGSKAVLSQQERKCGANLSGENSPFSLGSLSSGNVMQTPKSNSSSGKHVFPFWLNAEGSPKHHKDYAFDSLVEVLRMQSLSPKSHIQLWDPLGSTSPSNLIDCDQLCKTLDNEGFGISDPTLENAPECETRISWRDGLVSRIFEMDELDCCRCLSDEESEEESNKQIKAHHAFNLDEQNEKLLNEGFGSPEFLDHEPIVGVKGKLNSASQGPNLCAESISTDGGGLVASGDSDWTLCYKNELFQL